MRAGIAAFAGGVILLYCVGEIPPWQLSAFALIMGAGLWITKPAARTPAFCFLAVLAGLSWASWMSSDRLAMRLPSNLETGVHTVEGYRCSLVSPGSYGSLRFDFCVTGWPDGATNRPVPSGKLRLALYDAAPGTSLPIRLQLQVHLKRPHGHINPAGFRYETWLFRQGFDATGTVRGWSPAKVPCGLNCHYHALRDAVAQSLRARYGGLASYPLIESLLIGERRLLTADDWAVFRKTGTSHLIAISGLHIGLVGLFVGGLIRLVLRSPLLRQIGMRRQRALIVSCALSASTVYALLAGFTVPTQRALVMACLAGVVYLEGRLTGHWTAWLVAVFLVFLLDPFAPLDGGFWLSFGAVACLIGLFAGRLRPPGRIRAMLQAQAGVMAGLLPVLTVLGLPFSVMGWGVNVLAIPLVTLVLLPLLFILAPIGLVSSGLAPYAGFLLDHALGLFFAFLKACARSFPDAVEVAFLPAVIVAAIVVLCVGPFSRRTRLGLVLVGTAVGAFAFLSGGLAGEPVNPSVSAPELWVWDVGQGLSVTYREGRQVLLYDTGPGAPGGYTSVDAVIRPGLGYLGVQSLSWLVISHGDADHASGLPSLLSYLPVGRAVSGEPERVAERASGRRVFSVCEGSQTFAGSRIEFWRDPLAESGNAASCVARIIHDDIEIILPGDLTAEQERHWLDQNTLASGRRRIVVAPHHGSKTSSSLRWVRNLTPEIVVFSAGYRHPYGHPAEAIESRYRGVGARTFNTATSGAIHIVLGREGVEVSRQRDHAPFWIVPAPAQVP